MTTRAHILVITTASMILLFLLSSFSEKNEWTNLLDKNLSEWEMYLSYTYPSGYDGEEPLDEKGEPLKPIGYNKNVNNVFSVIEENGEPVLKISGEIYGCVFTRQEFENYHLKLKVKWGDKKWTPRKDLLKDSGILYHSIGECGIDGWRSWMLSQEMQIMEGHTGDYWSIASSAIEVRALIPEYIMNPVASEKQPFLAIGEGTDVDGFCLRSVDNENPLGEWTEVELICYEDKSLHIVNGQVVMILRNSHYMKNGKSIPLIKGKIQLQSEAAEVYYKDIKIRSLKSLPEAYISYYE